MTYDTHELAWAAGFFDGEGCFSCFVSKKRKTSQIKAIIAQVDIRPLRRFQDALGVGIGHMYGPYPHKNPKAKPLHYWEACSFEHVQQVICCLWNYLSEPKREQATRVLEKYHNLRPKEDTHGCKSKTGL